MKQIALASGADIYVEENELILEDLLKSIAILYRINEQDLFLGASTDFGLIFTLPRGIAVEGFLDDDSPPFYRLGEVRAGSGRVFLSKTNGDEVEELPGMEYKQ